MEPVYRRTLAFGTGESGHKFVKECEALAVRLGLLNAQGEPNFSALFKVAVKHLDRCKEPVSTDQTPTPQP